MKYNSVEKLLSIFNINLIKRQKKYVKDNFPPLSHGFGEENIIYQKYIDINTKEFYIVEVDEKFINFLYNIVDYVEYSYYKINDGNINTYDYEYIMKSIIEKFEKDMIDIELQQKYPELKEIMNEYEMKKVLLADDKDLRKMQK